MTNRFSLIAFSLILLACSAGAQDCPYWDDTTGALQFLLHYKGHGTDAEPVCVNRAFNALSGDATHIEDLIKLLDFERSTKHDDFKTQGGKYPATGALVNIGKSTIPYLIGAIKDSESELVQRNAAYALGTLHAPCIRGLMAMLEAEANKPETTVEQQQRLLAARDFLAEYYPLCKSEMDAQ